MPLCFIDPQDAIRVMVESVGREARRQLLGELVRAWVDEIPEAELASHYAKALTDLDEHDLSMPRPALLANLSHNLAASGRLEEAENVSRKLALDARGKGLSDVEATALNQLVRVAILRGDYAGARARLRDAIGRAAATRIEYVQIDCVLSFARIAAAVGDSDTAAPLLRYLLARPDLEPVDRSQAETCLHGLPAPLRETAAPEVALDTLVVDLATRLETPDTRSAAR
jgi:thioredoxin-like negative regulator of GroEL